MTIRRFAGVLALALVMTSCAQGPSDQPGGTSGDPADEFNQAFAPDEPYPLVASSELVVGKNRLLIGLQDANDAPVANPSIDMQVELFNLAESATEPVGEAEMDFVWTIKPYVGLFVGYVTLPEPGSWGVHVHAEGEDFDGEPLEVSAKTSFQVAEEGTTPGLGEKVPASDTLTSRDAPVSKISTDTHPDPRFYKMSIRDAVAAKKPFVLVFATPKYCESQVCGPTLEIVKGVSKDFSAINFIHVEPYDLSDPSALKPVPAVNEWGLPGEPWVFVVDGHGRLAAKYEGTVGPQELTRELAAL